MMKSLILAAALAALPSLAFAQAAAPAPAAPAAPVQAASTDVYDMACSNFHHNADGSWNAAKPMTLQPAAGPIALKPSFKFKPGTLFAGFDLAAALDKSCPH